MKNIKHIYSLLKEKLSPFNTIKSCFTQPFLRLYKSNTSLTDGNGIGYWGTNLKKKSIQ